jgi:hypothetical protein
MNYIRLAKDKVNDYVVTPVNNYVVTPVNDYVVNPVITQPINNYVVNPIHNLVRPKQCGDGDSDCDSIFVRETYTTFDSFKSEETSLLTNHSENDKVDISYLEHLKDRMYCSGVSLKASFYFFINALFPNTLKEEGYQTLEYLKKND